MPINCLSDIMKCFWLCLIYVRSALYICTFLLFYLCCRKCWDEEVVWVDPLCSRPGAATRSHWGSLLLWVCYRSVLLCVTFCAAVYFVFFHIWYYIFLYYFCHIFGIAVVYQYFGIFALRKGSYCLCWVPGANCLHHCMNDHFSL